MVMIMVMVMVMVMVVVMVIVMVIVKVMVMLCDAYVILLWCVNVMLCDVMLCHVTSCYVMLSFVTSMLCYVVVVLAGTNVKAKKKGYPITKTQNMQYRNNIERDLTTTIKKST